MKKISLIFVSFNLFLCLNAQVNTKIELFDLIKIFLPDKSMDYNAYDWYTGADYENPIQWLTDGLEWRNEKAYRRGEAIVTINGKYYECLRTRKEPCKWSISLKGSRAGYTSFSINSVNHPDIPSHYLIEGLLFNGEYKSTLLKSCDSNWSYGFYFYKVEMPEKKDFWLLSSYSCGSAGCSISVDCYTDINEADIECFNE